MRAIHVRLEGFSASFRHPLIISGTQLSLSVPGYSNILGMLSACAGRSIASSETRVGFEFRAASQDLELERKERLETKDSRLHPHSKGQSIGWRQVYWRPELDLFVTDLGLKPCFDRPATTPRFGRSQDLAWIRWSREIELTPVSRGTIGRTLVPYPTPGVGGMQVRLAEWFDNNRAGEPRRSGPVGHYIAPPSVALAGSMRFEVERSGLFHPSDAAEDDSAIYLHEWLTDAAG